ncbi:MAG: 50S ribosomal protein L25 [Acidimicrobiaceae bacterium]|nr:50S ribosomal protein L25 [Acidimicrobiaceae bacterium]
MTQITLNATTGRAEGTRNSRRLRTTGHVPAVVYGTGVDPVAVAVDAREFRQAVSGEKGLNVVIDLSTETRTYTVMARQIQRHPVKGTLSHVDFQVVDPSQPVSVVVPLHIIGDAVEIRHADWELSQALFRLTLKATPAAIPTHVDVDISHLRPGQSIRVADVVLPEGVVAAGDGALSVVTTRAGRAARTTERG